MSIIKTVLSLGALAATGIAVFSKGKYGEYKNVINSLQFKIEKIKKVSFQNGVTFDVDINIINPTNTAIDVPGKQLVIKSIQFFAKNGNKLGVAQPNLSNIQLPANGSRLITNIPVQLSLSEIGENFSEILDIASNPKNIILSLEVEAFGQAFTINSNK